MIWGSLIGIGVNEAAYGFIRNLLRPIQNLIGNVGQRSNLAGVKEIIPDRKILTANSPMNEKEVFVNKKK